MQEVALNIPDLGNEQLEPVFVWHTICYWLATGKDYDEFEERFQDLNTVMFLRALRSMARPTWKCWAPSCRG
jgi:hypothetical protein